MLSELDTDDITYVLEIWRRTKKKVLKTTKNTKINKKSFNL